MNELRKKNLLKRIEKRKFRKKIKRRKKREKRNTIKTEKMEFKAPLNLSISKNPQETIKLLKKMKEHCNSIEKDLLLNMKNIKHVDADALIYLRYIAQEVQDVKEKKINFYLKAPKEKKLRKYVYNSGFMSKNSKNKEDNRLISLGSNKNYKMINGVEPDKAVIKEIVYWLTEKIDLKFKLYPVIHEMMENTDLHAYTDNITNPQKSWHISVEEKSDRFLFVYLDSGEGLVETAPKKWHDIFKVFDTKSKILKAVLDGKHRSSSGDSYRNKGVPFIYENFNDNNIENLRIISGKGCFNLNRDKDLDEGLEGTLYYWEVKK